MDYIVYNEIVLRVYSNTCSGNPQSVTELLNNIYNSTVNITWGNRGMTDDGVKGICDVLAIHATFHSDWGYPISLKRRQEDLSSDNVGQTLYEKYHLPYDASCTLLGFAGTGYTTQDFVPLYLEEF
jgi:hypothetical protein